jgi:hypothetical protein
MRSDRTVLVTPIFRIPWFIEEIAAGTPAAVDLIFDSRNRLESRGVLPSTLFFMFDGNQSASSMLGGLQLQYPTFQAPRSVTKPYKVTLCSRAKFTAADENAPRDAMAGIPTRTHFATMSQPHLPDKRSIECSKIVDLDRMALPMVLSTAL